MAEHDVAVSSNAGCKVYAVLPLVMSIHIFLPMLAQNLLAYQTYYQILDAGCNAFDGAFVFSFAPCCQKSDCPVDICCEIASMVTYYYQT